MLLKYYSYPFLIYFEFDVKYNVHYIDFINMKIKNFVLFIFTYIHIYILYISIYNIYLYLYIILYLYLHVFIYIQITKKTKCHAIMIRLYDNIGNLSDTINLIIYLYLLFNIFLCNKIFFLFNFIIG